MKSLLKFLEILAALLLIGTLIWAGFSVISTSVEFGDASVVQTSGPWKTLYWSLGALIAYITLSMVNKRRS